MPQEIAKLKQFLLKARCVMVLTGAGISKDSGIPTFRGKDGWYKNHPPEELATPMAFNKNPVLVWEWYNYRRKIILSASPNEAHYKIAELEKYFPCFLLVTQNVDSLHRKAGSTKIVELHGNIFRTRCTNCSIEFYEDYRIFKDDELPPKCPHCGGILRPSVVWYGESLNRDDMEQAFSFANKADLILVVGTSGIVYPAAMLPYIVKSHGGIVVEINPDTTPISEIADLKIKDSAKSALSKLKFDLKS